MRKFGIEIEAFIKPAFRTNLMGWNTMRHVAEKISQAGVPCVAEGYNHSTREHWEVVSDGSLRNENGDSGFTFELVSPPMTDLVQVKAVCEVLKAIGATANKTCGLHVHMNARDLACEQAKAIIGRYAANENKIDAFMAPDRRGNAAYFAGTMVGTEQRIGRANSWDALVNSFTSRYYKVNVQSYLLHGTLEFRQHSGTVEFEEISSWVLFLENFIQTTAAATQAVVVEIGTGKKAIVRKLLSDGNEHSVSEIAAAAGYSREDALDCLRYIANPRRVRVLFHTVQNGEMVRWARPAAVEVPADIFAGLVESAKNFLLARIEHFMARTTIQPVAVAA